MTRPGRGVADRAPYPRLPYDNPPLPAWVPERRREPDCPFCRGVAFGIVGGLLLWAAIGAAAWHLWGRP